MDLRLTDPTDRDRAEAVRLFGELRERWNDNEVSNDDLIGRIAAALATARRDERERMALIIERDFGRAKIATAIRQPGVLDREG